MFGISNQSNPNNDILVPSSPEDISKVKFSPKQNLFTASSWKGDVRLWKIEPNGPQGKTQVNVQVPVLDIDWLENYIVLGCADNTAKLWDPVSQKQQQIAQHEAPIKCISSLNEQPNAVVTGSWDTNVKFWDVRKQGQSLNCSLEDRIYAMSCRSFVLVVAMANKKISIFDIRKPNSPVKNEESPLRLQTRCVSIFKESDGYCIGSIEGRVRINYFNDISKSFAFKCHRQQQPGTKHDFAYSVNDISFHPIYGTFSTCGSDGVVTFWDKIKKQRLKTFKKMAESVVSTDFNCDGTIFVYAVAYDYREGNRGIMGNQNTSQIYLKKVLNNDMKCV